MNFTSYLNPRTSIKDKYIIQMKLEDNKIQFTAEKKEYKDSDYIKINENPGVGEYDLLGENKKKIDYFLFLKKSKEIKERNDLKIKSHSKIIMIFKV